MGNSGHNWLLRCRATIQCGGRLAGLILRSRVLQTTDAKMRSARYDDVLRGRIFRSRKPRKERRKMRDDGRSEDTAGNCNGWNGTLAESKTNRVVFHDRKDRSEKGNEGGIHEARDRRGGREVEGGRKRRALTI